MTHTVLQVQGVALISVSLCCHSHCSKPETVVKFSRVCDMSCPGEVMIFVLTCEWEPCRLYVGTPTITKPSVSGDKLLCMETVVDFFL